MNQSTLPYLTTLHCMHVFVYVRTGAYTGAVSTCMLKDVGAMYVLCGHSERRTIFQVQYIPYNTLCSVLLWLMWLGSTWLMGSQLLSYSVSQSVSQSMTCEWVMQSDSQSCSLWVCQRSVSESVRVYVHWMMEEDMIEQEDTQIGEGDERERMCKNKRMRKRMRMTKYQ